MKKSSIFGLALILSLVVVSAGIGMIAGNTDIELSKADKDTLATRGVTTPVIEELVCDGETCRACANDNGYGMGCISIPQTYCSDNNETDCIAYTEYTEAELKVNRDEAFKQRWEGIADTMRQRDAKVVETKVGEGNVTLSEAK